LTLLKKIWLLIILVYCSSNLYGQSKITQLATLLKGLDTTWTLKIDSVRKQKNLIIGGTSVGCLIFTKAKQEIIYCLYQSSNNQFEESIRTTQKLASCSSIGWTEKNQTAKQNDLAIFLSIYPCWSEYSEDAKKLIQKIFNKLMN
jgi:hypothetical protein